METDSLLNFNIQPKKSEKKDNAARRCVRDMNLAAGLLHFTWSLVLILYGIMETRERRGFDQQLPVFCSKNAWCGTREFLLRDDEGRFSNCTLGPVSCGSSFVDICGGNHPSNKVFEASGRVIGLVPEFYECGALQSLPLVISFFTLSWFFHIVNFQQMASGFLSRYMLGLTGTVLSVVYTWGQGSIGGGFGLVAGLWIVQLYPGLIIYLLNRLLFFLPSFTIRYDYWGELMRERSYSRWLEYSFSASVMILIITYFIGNNDRNTMVLFFVTIFGVQWFGYAGEFVSKKEKVWQRLFFHFVGWVLMLTVIVLSGLQFAKTLESADTAPNWLWSIIVGDFILFSSFSFVQLYQFLRKDGPCCTRLCGTRCGTSSHLQGEIQYIVLSFVCKSFLGVIAAFNIVSQDVVRDFGEQ